MRPPLSANPMRAMHAVRSAADRRGFDDAQQAEVPTADVLAALAQLDEARAALDTLEHDLTRAARRRHPAAAARHGVLALLDELHDAHHGLTD